MIIISILWFLLWIGLIFIAIFYIFVKSIPQQKGLFYIIFLFSLAISLYIKDTIWIPLFIVFGGGHGSGINHISEYIYILYPIISHFIIAILLLYLSEHQKTIIKIIYAFSLLLFLLVGKIYFDANQTNNISIINPYA